MRIIHVLLIVVLIFSKDITAQQLSQEYSINSQELAYEKAIQFTGFNTKTHTLKSLSEKNNIKLKILDKENLPIKNQDFNGEKVWEIVFPNLTLNLPRWNDSIINNQIKKTFKVIIDAKTGSLIKIIAQLDTTKIFFYNKKTKSSLESELSRHGEKYLDVSVDVPKISMLDALAVAPLTSPLMAEEIHMVCVVYKSEFEESKILAWCISSYNIINNTNNSILGSSVITVVNATTGQPLHSTNLQPFHFNNRQ